MISERIFPGFERFIALYQQHVRLASDEHARKMRDPFGEN